MKIVADKTIDTSGLSCPLPILHTNKALKKMLSGQILEVISTDSGSTKDFDTFCSLTSNELIETIENNNIYTFIIKKT
jgi:tRNA 2-thiouridine synthesizing protein A